MWFPLTCFWNEGMKSSLKWQLHDERKVWETVEKMAPYKASGPNGLHTFFQDNWSIVGKDTFNLQQKVYKGEASVASRNKTNLILLPKVDSMKNMSEFRAIGLCNVISQRQLQIS